MLSLPFVAKDNVVVNSLWSIRNSTQSGFPGFAVLEWFIVVFVCLFNPVR